MLDRLRALEVLTRPEHPDLTAALAKRWDELPAHVKTRNQMLGRRTAGCEGTHGVFPKCNLACTPCYHAKEAQRVRTDGEHTLAEVDSQMAFLRQARGPGQNAQLIGGEVSLLEPDDLAGALLSMIEHGRKPMSLSHGDFSYEYLERVALDPRTGKPRFKSLSFAGHFDSTMLGRTGIKKVEREEQLNPFRKAFCDMFKRLEEEHGVTSYLAHNMTITPRNIDQIPEVLQEIRHYGFRMFSHQPAAFVGNAARWKEQYRSFSTDAVWERIQEGAGGRLHDDALHIGDKRCNRTAYGFYVGDRYVPLLDEDSAADARWLDSFVAGFGGMDFAAPAPVTAARVARALASEPKALPRVAGFGARVVKRSGGLRALRATPPKAITYVMHSFMDAKTVRPAWEAMERGEHTHADPEVEATIERLRACSYAMAHPEDGRTVPACAQHSVLDPLENLKLMELLPALPGPDPLEAPTPAVR